MTRSELISLIHRKQSFLCVGLDSDVSKIPAHLRDEPDPVFAFNKAIINATLPFTVAYKPNLAFYESRGIAGLKSLEKTMEYLENFKDQVFTIADAKRGDIGNTSQHYALSVFSKAHSGIEFDAVTVAPYMGSDSVKPFLEFKDKWVVLLALTSNQGSQDFQHLTINSSHQRLFEEVLSRSYQWGGTPDKMMFVAGATQASLFTDIRRIVPDHFLLVPGVGAQGGSLEEVAHYGMNRDCGLLVNSSRAIIFASDDRDFAEAAANEAQKMQQQMARMLSRI
ncbi:MAG: orotidine-5'-phosphate decarboxylase [Bacteroidales bacterium]